MPVAPVQYAYVAIKHVAIRDRLQVSLLVSTDAGHTKIKNLPTLGVGLKSAIQASVSSNSYWQMSRTPMITQAISKRG